MTAATGATKNITKDAAREYLDGRGYEAEAATVLAEARRFPGRYAYTTDRYAWAVYRMPAGSWVVGDSTESERRIAALATARRNGWRWASAG